MFEHNRLRDPSLKRQELRALLSGSRAIPANSKRHAVSLSLPSCFMHGADGEYQDNARVCASVAHERGYGYAVQSDHSPARARADGVRREYGYGNVLAVRAYARVRAFRSGAARRLHPSEQPPGGRAD